MKIAIKPSSMFTWTKGQPHKCASSHHYMTESACAACHRERAQTVRYGASPFLNNHDEPLPGRQVPGSSSPSLAAIETNFVGFRSGHSVSHMRIHPIVPGALQTQLTTEQPTDQYEPEADRIAELMTADRRSSALRIPLHAGLMIQRAARDDAAPSVLAAATAEAEPTLASTTTTGQTLIVEDTAEAPGPEQMRKSEFLTELRAAVCRSAEEALAGTGRSAQGCPYIDHWFSYYSNQTSSHIERALRRYAPAAASVTAARDYIPLVAERIGRSVRTWVTTGEITGVPEELASQLPGAGFLGAVGGFFSGIASAVTSTVSSVVSGIGNVLSGIGSLLFKARDGGAGEDADPHMIQSQLGAGSSLDSSVRTRMETAFGHDFSRVRVHTDAQAAALSNSLNARAFTIGLDVAFGAEEYRPGTLIGDALIAHELAHVVQQSGGSSVPMKSGQAQYDTLEEDADQSAVEAMISLWNGPKSGLARVAKTALPRLKSGLGLQRCGPSLRTQPVQQYEADTYIQGRFGRRVAQAIVEGRIASNAEFVPVDDQGICDAHNEVNMFWREQGKPIDDTPCEKLIAFVDPRPMFTRPRVWIHRTRQTTETVLHEALHVYSHPNFPEKLRNPINEGTTEYFTRQIAEAQRIAVSGSYEERYKQIRILVGVLGNQEPLERAYFQGDIRGLQRTVDSIRRPPTFEAWRCEMTMTAFENAEALLAGTAPEVSVRPLCVSILPRIE
jgi:hypothetical protein